MGRSETELCPQCGKRLPLLRRLASSAFCSAAHEEAYKHQQAALVLAALGDTERQLAQPRRPLPLPRRQAQPAPEAEFNLPVSGFLTESQECIDAARRPAGGAALAVAPAEGTLPVLPPRRYRDGLASVTPLPGPAHALTSDGLNLQPSAEPGWASEALLPGRVAATLTPVLAAGTGPVAIDGHQAVHGHLAVADVHPSAAWSAAEPAAPDARLVPVEPPLCPTEAALLTLALAQLSTAVQDEVVAVQAPAVSPVGAGVAAHALPVLKGSPAARMPVIAGGGGSATGGGSTARPPRRKPARKPAAAKLDAPAGLRALDRQLGESLAGLQPVPVVLCPGQPARRDDSNTLLAASAEPDAPPVPAHAPAAGLNSAGTLAISGGPALTLAPQPPALPSQLAAESATHCPAASATPATALRTGGECQLVTPPLSATGTLTRSACQPETQLAEPGTPLWSPAPICPLPRPQSLVEGARPEPVPLPAQQLAIPTEAVDATPQPGSELPTEPPAVAATLQLAWARPVRLVLAPAVPAAPPVRQSGDSAILGGPTDPATPQATWTSPHTGLQAVTRQQPVASVALRAQPMPLTTATPLIAAMHLPPVRLQTLWTPPQISAEPEFVVPPMVKWVFPLQAGHRSGPIQAPRRRFRLAPAVWGEWMSASPIVPQLQVRLQTPVLARNNSHGAFWHKLRLPAWRSRWLSRRTLVPAAVALLALPLAYRVQPELPNVKGKPGAAGSEFEQMIASRAAVHCFDNFRGGLGAWSGGANWARSWKYGVSGLVEPGQLALYSPTVALRDYDVEFLAQIGRRSLNWVVRAADVKNYHAMRIVITRPGPLPLASIVRYAVVNGQEQAAAVLPLPMAVPNDMLFQVRTEVRGSDYTTYVQGQVVDHFSDSRRSAGGVGFFSPAGDRSHLHWVEVNHQYDYLGRLCALLAPYRVTPAPSRVDRRK